MPRVDVADVYPGERLRNAERRALIPPYTRQLSTSRSSWFAASWRVMVDSMAHLLAVGYDVRVGVPGRGHRQFG